MKKVNRSDCKIVLLSPLNLVNILAREEIDDTLPDVLVDGHVKDGIDEAVAVGENHHVSHQFWIEFFAARSGKHEEEGIGPPADQEGGSDAPHDQSDPSEVLVILPNIKTVKMRRCQYSVDTDMFKFRLLK